MRPTIIRKPPHANVRPAARLPTCRQPGLPAGHRRPGRPGPGIRRLCAGDLASQPAHAGRPCAIGHARSGSRHARHDRPVRRHHAHRGRPLPDRLRGCGARPVQQGADGGRVVPRAGVAVRRALHEQVRAGARRRRQGGRRAVRGRGRARRTGAAQGQDPRARHRQDRRLFRRRRQGGRRPGQGADRPRPGPRRQEPAGRQGRRRPGLGARDDRAQGRHPAPHAGRHRRRPGARALHGVHAVSGLEAGDCRHRLCG